MHKFAALALILTTVVALPTTAEAKKRPTVSTGEECFYDQEADEDISEGVIVSCCYEDGCWICSRDYTDCVWDGKYRTFLLRKTFNGISAGMDAGKGKNDAELPEVSNTPNRSTKGGDDKPGEPDGKGFGTVFQSPGFSS